MQSFLDANTIASDIICLWLVTTGFILLFLGIILYIINIIIKAYNIPELIQYSKRIQGIKNEIGVEDENIYMDKEFVDKDILEKDIRK